MDQDIIDVRGPQSSSKYYDKICEILKINQLAG